MHLKHLLTSVCLVLALNIGVCKPVLARHVVSDPAATAMSIQNLVQDILAVVKKIADLNEFIKRNTSQGSIGAIANKLDFSKMQKEVLDAAKSTVPETLKDVGFEDMMKDTQQMMSFLKEDLMLPLQSSSQEEALTDTQKQERLEKRQDVKNTAISDAYATAVAYLNRKTKAQEEIVNPTKKVAGSADTIHAKEGAANEAALARLNEGIERNALLAELLKLRAAEALGNIPLDG
ncbi:MAG: hypothetical protein E7013_01010 [Alphaproteobacteria bacterium]|nr:hypothetical protein [Alphaproteobacteria bacterium]